MSDDASVDYAEPPANADNASGGSAAPVVQHTDNEPAVGESDDSDTSSGYVGGTEDVGSADVDASPMDGDSATVETQAPASYADRTVDTDDEAAGNAGPDYAEPPADAGGASNDVAAPSAQRTDSDDVSGEGNTGFAGGNGGGDNYSSDEETAPTAQGAKAPADEDDSGIGEPPQREKALPTLVLLLVMRHLLLTVMAMISTITMSALPRLAAATVALTTRIPAPTFLRAAERKLPMTMLLLPQFSIRMLAIILTTMAVRPTITAVLP